MKTYKHLSEEERNDLVVMLNRKESLRAIARALNRNPGTISREIKRNFGRTRYRAHRALERAIDRHHNAHKKERLKTHALRNEVERLLSIGWSPELIAGRLKKRKDLPVISHESIYQWVYADKPHLIGNLVRSHQTRWPKGKSKHSRKHFIADKVPLVQRPEAANKRTQIGHWETDLVIGKGRSALKVAVERKHRLTKLKKVSDKTAPSSNTALLSMLGPLPDHAKRSITYDNGSENTDHSKLNLLLGTSSFFCEPYHSWEKGTVENTNGLIRRFLPKDTNFDTMSDEAIQKVESWLNDRPRKCLDFFTPQESFDLGVALTG